MPDSPHQYGRWTKEELRKAEITACQFLQENSVEISDTMQAKANYLETLIQRLAQKDTTFEDRLEYFARISEIAQLIREDADGFFGLASQPVVARILSGVPKKG